MFKKFTITKIFCLVILFIITAIPKANAGYSIVKMSNPSFCSSYPSSYVTGSFSISETGSNKAKRFKNGQTNATLIIGFSNASFQFNPGVGTVTATGTEVTIVSYNITSSSITVTINTSSSNVELNTINFNNIQVNAIAAATGYIRRTGGTFVVDRKASNPSSSVSWGDLTASTPLSYSSSTSTQTVTSTIFSGSTNNQVLGLQVVVTGTCSSITTTAFNLNTTGSTAATDIANAKIYYTGTTNVFSTNNLFGTTNNPNGTYTISGSQALNLGAGTYYFWLTYDLIGSAVASHIIDGQLVSSVVSGNTFTPTTGNPSGSRTVSTNVFYSIAAGSWSSTTNWSRTSGGASCSCAPTGGNGFVYVNNSISLDNTYSIDNVVVQSGGNLSNLSGKLLTVTSGLSTTGTGLFAISSSWVLNNITTAGTGLSSSSAALSLSGSLNVGSSTTLQITGGVAIAVNGNITANGILALGTSNLTNSNAAGTTISGTDSITGSGMITLGINKTIPVGTNLTISPSISISNGVVITNNGTINMLNDITGSNSNSQWTNAANSVLNMGGTTSSLLSIGRLDASAVPNTVSYIGSGNQTINTSISGYYNLYATSAASGIKSLASSVTINNDLQIATGAQLNAGANTINLYGNLINNSTHTTPFVSTGTVSFSGSNDTISGIGVTSFNILNIVSTGTLTSNSNTGKVIVTGNWINDGIFNHNKSDISFNGTTTMSGSLVTEFYNLIVNATKTLTVDPTEVDIDGDLTVNGTLNHNNSLIVFLGDANTQNINGTVASLSLYKVEIANNSGNVAMTYPLTINNLLTLTAGNLILGANNLTLGASVAAIGGSPFSASNMIVASGSGLVIKNGTSAASASYTFPVGDNTGTVEYSPITLTFSAGTYTSGSARVKVVNAKHPNITFTSNYLSRYWTVSTTGYTVTGAVVSATYLDADIVGSESSMLMGKWGGSLPWITYPSSLTAATNTLTSPTISSFGDFTGTYNVVQWTGNVSTDWNSAGNWDNGAIPTTATSVVIPADAIRMPSIVSSVVCNNITVNTGATVANTNSGTLNIAGTFVNNGTYTDNGTTNFNGTTSQQTFSGISTFNNLTLNNTSSLLLSTNIIVNGNLLISAGILNANNFNISLKGNWSNNASTTAFTAGTATVTLSGTIAQSIGGSFVTTFNNLTIANSSNTVSLNSNISIAGNLNVSAGVFDLAGFTANRTSSGGILSVANNATLKISGTDSYPSNYATNTLVVASTVEYAGTNQTVANQLYGNLKLSSSSGAVIKTFPATALTIVGNLTSTLGAGTSVSFTAAANITVSGNVSIGASTTFNAASYSHNVGGNWTNNGTFNGNTSTITLSGPGSIVSGSSAQNFNNLTIAASFITFSNNSVTLTGNLATISSGSFSLASGGTLSMTGSGSTISGTGISLENLTVSGSVTTVSSFNLTGNLSVSGSFTASAGTITMSGVSKNISGSGTKSFTTLSVTGSVTTDANFSISSSITVGGSLTASAGTATFTNTSTLSGTPNLYNITINGTSLQLSANAVLGVANVFTIATGTLNVTSSTPNTVNFNGSGSQNINGITYDNLILSNGNSKSAIASITVNNNITIAANTTFIAGSFTHYIYNDFNNYGSFTADSGTIEFLGNQTSTINGATTFNILTVNNTNATTAIVLNNNVSVATVNMVSGKILTGSDTITITTTRTGSGIIMGNIRRTHSFTTGVAYAFEGADNTITFSVALAVTSITVSVAKQSVPDFTLASAVNRLYTISVPTGTYVATLRLHYEDDELNGNNESSMSAWNYNGILWIPVVKTANSTTSNYVEQSGLANITNRWTFGGPSNAAQWTGAVSSDWNNANNWVSVLGSSSLPPSSNDVVAIGSAAFANQPTINTAVSVKNIVFGTAQNVTLSMASGGSLTSGDILTVWDSSATHTINANSQTIIINGDLTLSDGTSGHQTNLNIGSGTVTVAGKLTQSGSSNIVFSAAGNLNIGGDYNYVNGTFTSNTGTVTYNGVNNQVVAGVSYSNLTINKSAAEAFINSATTITGNFAVTAGEVDNFSITTILGDVTIASGAILENFNILHIGGNWNNNGVYEGNGVNTVFDGSGTQNISATTFNNLEFNKPVGSLAILTGDVTLKGNLVGTSGTLDIKSFFFNKDVVGGSATITDSATLIVAADNAPTKFANYYLAPNSTVIFNGTSTQHLALPGVVYGNLTFRNSGTKILYTPITVIGNLTIENNAIFDAGSQTITLNGNWINNGTFTPSTSTIIATGTSKTITGISTFNRFSVYGSYTVLNNLTFNSLLNINPTGALYGDGNINVTMNGDLVNRGTLYTLGTTTYTGNVIQNLSLINAVQTVALTVNFNGTIPPVLNSTSAPQFGYLNINNTGGINPSVGWTILYALTIGSGASFNGGISTHNMLGSVTNNGTITSSGTLNFIPSSTATINLGSNFSSTGTVVFGGAGALTLAGSPTSFKNVIISNSNGAGITTSSAWSITNNLTVNSSSIFNAGNYTHSIGGNFLNNGTISSGTSTFVLNGINRQDIYNPSAFNNLTVNKTTGTALLFANATINGVLNFVKGSIQTGNNVLIQPSTGTVTGAAQNTGWIDGKFQKYLTTGATSKIFEVGDTISYTPVSVAFSNVTTSGNLTAFTTAGDHPNISSSAINTLKSVNRYWSFINSGISFTTYNVSFKYPATNMDAGASSASFGVSLYTGSTWLLPVSTLPTDTSIQTTGVTSFGDFAIGEICNAGTTISYTSSPYCSASGTATVTQSGTTGGIFSSTTGLSINSSTGLIGLEASNAGTYSVNYNIDATGGCSSFTTATSIIITAAPTATILYSGSPYCSNAGIVYPTRTGTTSGIFSSTIGLIINSTNGSIDLAASTKGTYTVTYTIAASGGCNQYSTTTSVTIGTAGLWTGAINTDWNTAGNWSCAIPASNDDVVIPLVSNLPLLAANTVVNNINLNGVLYLNGYGLTINGVISGSGSLSGSNTSKLTIASSSNAGTINFNQTTSADATITDGTNALQDFIINGNTGSITIGNKLNLFNRLSVNPGTLNTNGYLVLRSTNSNTAFVDQVGGIINGQVIVERYMHNQYRGWRAITAPITYYGLTINDSSNTIKRNWQSDWGYGNNYGTRITGPVTPTAANGLDDYSLGVNLQTYNPATAAWNKVVNTITETQSNATATAANKGFFLYVRGDRTVTPNGSNPYNFTSTTLASKGLLQMGTQLFNYAGNSGQFWLVGNPYACPVDMSVVTANNIGQFVYVWDPNLANANLNTSGNYATFDRTTWLAGPTSGSSSNYFQSGQAFFVLATTQNANITFTETNKVSSVFNNTHTTGIANGLSDIFNVKLLSVKSDGTTSEIDGARAKFGSNYSNNVDSNDAAKWTTVGIENISLKRSNKLLAIESRPYIISSDTLFLNVAYLNVGSNYQLKINSINFDASVSGCKLVDNFLNTVTPLSLSATSTVNFNVTSVTGSNAANRFYILFDATGNLPTSNSLTVKAYKQNNGIKIDWEAIAENSIKNYSVEKSTDGIAFNKLLDTAAKNGNVNNEYSYTDNHPVLGFNYYRIKSTEVNNNQYFSPIVKIEMIDKNVKSVKVYPNPVAGKVLGMQLTNMDAGKYIVKMFSVSGQEVWASTFNHNGNNGNISLKLDGALAAGIYHLQIIDSKGNGFKQTILIEE